MPLGSIQDALARICRGIEANEALSLVIGPPGTGKSLLGALVAQHYRKTHDVVVLGGARIDDREAFLRHLLHHLRVDESRIRDGDLQLALIDHLCGDESPEGGLLVIIDEAQSLSTEVMEAIRMVTNIMHHGVPRVAAVVCGGVKLDDMLVEPSMEAFTQRVATRCYLHPLNGEETRQYIRQTIRACGADPEGTINDEAIATIHHACCGVPRLINQLMTQAIDCAEEADQAMINERIIDIAWSQLQQLPGPMVEEPRMELEPSSVEFGELGDSGSWRIHDQGQGGIRRPESGPISEIDDIVVDGDSELFLDEDDVARDRNVVAEDDNLESSPAPTDREPMTEPSVFGEFEDEEEIALGTGVAASPRETVEPTCDLEQALHQEIVGLSDYLSEVLDGAGEESAAVDTEQFHRQDGAESARSKDVDECAANEQIDAADQEQQDSTPREPEQSLFVIEQWNSESISIGEIAFEESTREQTADEQGSAEESVEDESSQSTLPIGDRLTDSEQAEEEVARDDSDLLVIEDDVEIRRIDAAKRYDSLDQTISVDFQAMLSRMRSRSE